MFFLKTAASWSGPGESPNSSGFFIFSLPNDCDNPGLSTKQDSSMLLLPPACKTPGECQFLLLRTHRCILGEVSSRDGGISAKEKKKDSNKLELVSWDMKPSFPIKASPCQKPYACLSLCRYCCWCQTT